MNIELPRDPSLPGIRTAWSGDAMLDRFREVYGDHIDGWCIERCRVERFRYRPAIRSIVLYELILRNTAGTERRQWVTGSLYPGKRAKRRSRRLGAYAEASAGLSPLPGVLYLGKPSVLLQAYPMDRHLSALPRIFRHEADELDELILSSLPDGSEIAGRKIETVRYRPGISSTLRYRIDVEQHNGQQRQHTFYLKCYREAESGLSACKLYRHICHTLQVSTDGLNSARPLGWIPTLNVLVLESARGLPLETLLLEKKDNWKNAVADTARALLKFHNSPARFLVRHGVDGMLSRSQRALNFIAWALPDLQQRAAALQSLLEKKLVNIPFRPAHMDLKVDHVFLDDSQVMLIDLDFCAISDPVFDVAMLAVRLEAMQDILPLSRQRAQAASDLLVDVYFEGAPADWRRRFAVNTACASLKVALFYLQHQVDDWPQKVTALFESAEQWLVG